MTPEEIFNMFFGGGLFTIISCLFWENHLFVVSIVKIVNINLITVIQLIFILCYFSFPQSDCVHATRRQRNSNVPETLPPTPDDRAAESGKILFCNWVNVAVILTALDVLIALKLLPSF